MHHVKFYHSFHSTLKIIFSLGYRLEQPTAVFLEISLLCLYHHRNQSTFYNHVPYTNTAILSKHRVLTSGGLAR